MIWGGWGKNTCSKVIESHWRQKTLVHLLLVMPDSCSPPGSAGCCWGSPPPGPPWFSPLVPCQLGHYQENNWRPWGVLNTLWPLQSPVPNPNPLAWKCGVLRGRWDASCQQCPSDMQESWSLREMGATVHCSFSLICCELRGGTVDMIRLLWSLAQKLLSAKAVISQ